MRNIKKCHMPPLTFWRTECSHSPPTCCYWKLLMPFCRACCVRSYLYILKESSEGIRDNRLPADTDRVRTVSYKGEVQLRMKSYSDRGEADCAMTRGRWCNRAAKRKSANVIRLFIVHRRASSSKQGKQSTSQSVPCISTSTFKSLNCYLLPSTLLISCQVL